MDFSESNVPFDRDCKLLSYKDLRIIKSVGFIKKRNILATVHRYFSLNFRKANRMRGILCLINDERKYHPQSINIT